MESLSGIIASKWSLTALIPVLLFIIGKLSDSVIYVTLRTNFGKAMHGVGKMLSKLGNSKLGPLWEPIERPILDFILFGIEQIGAGARSDNIKDIEDHVERLKSVGSKWRIEALESKLDLLRNPSNIPAQSIEDAAIRAKLLGGIGDSASDKLKG